MSKSTSGFPGPLESLREAWNEGGELRSRVLWGLVALTVACALGVRFSVWIFRGTAVQGEVVAVSGDEACSLQFMFKSADGKAFTFVSDDSSNSYCDLRPGAQVPVRYFPNNPAIAKPFPLGKDDWILLGFSAVLGLLLTFAPYLQEVLDYSREERAPSSPAQPAQEPLKPGEVHVGRAMQAERAGSEVSNSKGSMAILYAVIAALVVVPSVTAFVTPAPLSAGGPPPASRFLVPELPEPPSGYAMALTERKPGITGDGKHETSPAQVNFEYESVQIILVPPGDYAPGDRDRLIDLPASGEVTYASRVDRNTSDAPPYRLTGDVDVTCGPIIGHDAANVALMLMGGNVARASIQTVANGVRGPPRVVRRVYVVGGTVKSFHGPDQFHESVLNSKVMDLGPEKKSAEDYERKAERFQSEVKQLEEKFNVPAGQLKAHAGQVVTVADSKVVKNVDPTKMKLVKKDGAFRPDEEYVQNSNRLRERGNSAPLEERVPKFHPVR